MYDLFLPNISYGGRFWEAQMIPLQNEVSDKGSSGQRQPEAGSEVPSDSADAQRKKPEALVVEFNISSKGLLYLPAISRIITSHYLGSLVSVNQEL